MFTAGMLFAYEFMDLFKEFVGRIAFHKCSRYAECCQLLLLHKCGVKGTKNDGGVGHRETKGSNIESASSAERKRTFLRRLRAKDLKLNLVPYCLSLCLTK